MKKLQYIKILFLALPVIIYYHLFYHIRFNRHPEKYSIERRYQITRKEVIKVLKIFKVDIHEQGLSLFSSLKEKTLIISNHHSLIDPLMVIALSEKPVTFVAKKEVFKMPFVKNVAKTIDVFGLDRENIMNQISQIKNIVSYLKDESKPSVIIFIEGTRNKKPEGPCLEFHAGTLKIAQMANCPLILDATYGTFRILNSKSYAKPYPVSVNMFDILDKETVRKANTSELANELKARMDAEIDKLRVLDKNYINNSKLSKKRKELETRVDVRVNS